MAKRKKVKGTASPMPIGIGGGVLLGSLLLAVITFVSAWLVYKEHISTNALGYLLMAGQLASALTATWFAIRQVQRRKAIVGLITGGILFLLLLGINKVFFGGHYRGVLTTSILFLIGIVVAVYFTSREGQNRHKGKNKNTSLCKIPNR